jgi:hypothetical protein
MTNITVLSHMILVIKCESQHPSVQATKSGSISLLSWSRPGLFRVILQTTKASGPSSETQLLQVFESAPMNSRKSMQLCDFLTSTCYFFRFMLFISKVHSFCSYPWFLNGISKLPTSKPCIRFLWFAMDARGVLAS